MFDLVIAKAPPPSWMNQACGDWMGGTGGVPPGARIVKALKPLVARIATDKGIETPEAWDMIRPYWRKFCASRAARFGPESFAANPKQVIEDEAPVSKVGAMLEALD
jgi:hypothetical protein